jgi:hypothetical protein
MALQITALYSEYGIAGDLLGMGLAFVLGVWGTALLASMVLYAQMEPNAFGPALLLHAYKEHKYTIWKFTAHRLVVTLLLYAVWGFFNLKGQKTLHSADGLNLLELYLAFSMGQIVVFGPGVYRLMNHFGIDLFGPITLNLRDSEVSLLCHQNMRASLLSSLFLFILELVKLVLGAFIPLLAPFILLHALNVAWLAYSEVLGVPPTKRKFEAKPAASPSPRFNQI